MRIFLSLVAVLALASARVDAQRTLRGIVTDSGGYPLPNVEVRIMELGRLSRSDVQGRFVIERITDRVVDVTLRRLGYEVRSVRVSMIKGEGDSLRVVMRAEPLRLNPVEIEAKEDQHPFFAEY
jgi:hypothetical protein